MHWIKTCFLMAYLALNEKPKGLQETIARTHKDLKFYTKMLGFIKKADISAGGYRWLTVVSPEDQTGTELVLEPNQNPAAKTYQQALFKQGIRAAAFFVDDVQKEYERLKKTRRKLYHGANKAYGYAFDACSFG